MDRNILDAAKGGALVNKTPTAAKALIENMSLNSKHFTTRTSQRIKPTPAQTVVNPKGPNANVSAISLRSGKGTKYANFLKDLCTSKRRLKGNERVNLGQIISALIQPKHSPEKATASSLNQVIPQKCKDPGTFAIPCTIGDSKFENCMLNLGEGINVIPTSVYNNLDLGPLQHTSLIIKLANRRNARPIGVVEDVLVQVNDLIFPADFYILDMYGKTNSRRSPVILGRPFMKTTKIKIDVDGGIVSMEFGDIVAKFKIFDAMKHPLEEHSIFHIELMSEFVDAIFSELFSLDFHLYLGLMLLIHGNISPTSEVVIEAVYAVEALDIPAAPNIPSIEQPPSLELKQLSENLNMVLRKHKKEIGWTLADISVISPSMCMHKILLEDGCKIVRQPQRRLNALILDVVKKEVTKLLQACIIYPISNSKWVSPLQVVLKKSGLTVVINENNELVPTRVQNRCRVCIDYRRLNQATRKDHFAFLFIDQMLERLAGKSHYCFVDDFSDRCLETDLVLNYEKCHFMLEHGIVLGHIIYEKGISLDPTKVDVISKLPYPSCIREIRSFLGHASFYRRYIEDFIKITLPLSNLLKNDVTFNFDDNCKKSNYTTTEKELLAIAFALDKFRSYLLGSKVTVFTDHATL
ncbi:uncharacterized protein LOC127080201 [Lathyrus oleraceus]|uniref:uncharacterized protein LOC127080201 n=1 Tax=Pisum sativum TaxID=3888 RepID=UPI0021CE3003|nr:uncharacterized protein LOC127080201 [Pisum sativum]